MASIAKETGTLVLPPGRTGRIGLVSDTHGMFDPLLPELLKDVAAILHAGDVGSPEILDQFKKICPILVTVSGNVDTHVPGLEKLPAFAKRSLMGIRILITHYTGSSDFLLPPVTAAIKKEKPALVLSGHTHKPLIEEKDGILYVNPGSCGPRRFELPRTCGILTVQAPSEAELKASITLVPRINVTLWDLDTRKIHAEYNNRN